MKKKTPENDAYIWLQDEEVTATADCGCQIDGQAFYQCRMHQAAPDILNLVKCFIAQYDDISVEDEEAVIGAARRLVAKLAGK